MEREPVQTNRLSRRTFVSAGVLTAVSIAGCLGDEPNADEESETDDIEDVDPELRLNGQALSSAFPFRLTDPETSDTLAEVHWHGEYTHWHFAPLEVPLGGSLTSRVEVIDHEIEEIPVGRDEQYGVTIHETAETPADLLEAELTDDVLTVHGKESGEGELVFQLVAGDEVVYQTPPLRTHVMEG